MAALAGLDLPSTLVFDYPSVAEIAEYIAGLLPPPERSRKSSLAALQQGQLVAAGSNNGGSVRVSATVPSTALATPAPVDGRRKLEVVTANVNRAARMRCVWCCVDSCTGTQAVVQPAPARLPNTARLPIPNAGSCCCGQGDGWRGGGSLHPPHDRRP